MNEIKDENIDKLYNKLNKDAKASGYNLNPDVEFTKSLIKGLLINIDRYTYPACPCRLATGNRANDLDVICPCDYRDMDLNEYGMCYCGLYVTNSVLKGEQKIKPIHERRFIEKNKTESEKNIFNLSLPVWRCKVCGYLCARENPPEICPICKAQKDRFEKFI